MSGPRSAPPTEERAVDSETPVSRRRMLGATGVALVTAVAGCTAEASHQPAAQPLVDETVRVDPGRYETVDFRLDEKRWTSVNAHLSDRSVQVKTDGPAVDVVTMSPSQYSQFQEQQTFEYIGGVSMPDVVNGEVSAMLESGDYVVLVDNSSAGVATPGSSSVTAVVNLEITASENRPS